MYPVPIQQNEAAAARRLFPIWMVDSDGITPLTGLTGTPELTQPDGSQAAATNAMVEVDSTNHPGLYNLALEVAEIAQKGVILVSHQEGTSAQFHGTAYVTDDEAVLAAIAAKQVAHDARFDAIDSELASIANAIEAAVGASIGRVLMRVDGQDPAFLLVFAQGEDVAIQLRYVDGNGEALSLLGRTIHFRMKEDVTQPDVIKKTSADPTEISVDNEAAGYATVFLTRAETGVLNVFSYYADCWTVDDATADQDRVSKGTVKVEAGGSFAP